MLLVCTAILATSTAKAAEPKKVAQGAQESVEPSFNQLSQWPSLVPAAPIELDAGLHLFENMVATVVPAGAFVGGASTLLDKELGRLAQTSKTLKSLIQPYLNRRYITHWSPEKYNTNRITAFKPAAPYSPQNIFARILPDGRFLACIQEHGYMGTEDGPETTLSLIIANKNQIDLPLEKCMDMAHIILHFPQMAHYKHIPINLSLIIKAQCT